MSQEVYRYNRIVVIGNGLDLALGLKTSYSDYLTYYIKNCLEIGKYDGYKDELFSSNTLGFMYGDEFQRCTTFQDLANFFENREHLNVQFYGILKEIVDFHKIEKWVDIETLYYDSLLPKFDLIKSKKTNRRGFEAIETFNNSFRVLSENLDKYMALVASSPLSEVNSNLFYDFLVSCVRKELNNKVYLNHGIPYESLQDPENVLFLNFNYTDSLKKILGYSGLKPQYPIIDIHGQAGSTSNPIIFGYGDDTHPRYSELEGENTDSLLEFIKSFYYNRTTDYHKMLGFMEMDKYEVYIVGHSCGLSDRTLLKSIFENNNCLSIKIYHRGNISEHLKKNMAISRHFEDKLLLRKRVLPFDEHAIIPQAK